MFGGAETVWEAAAGELAELLDLEKSLAAYNAVLDQESRNRRALEAIESIHFRREDWKRLLETYERAIDGHIRNLRRKLEPDDAAGTPRYVRTVHGVGYALAEPEG